MTTKVQIHITGLAVCYLADNDWKVDFLCDDNHQLFYSHDGDPSSSTALGKSQTIEILAEKPVNSSSEKGENFKEIFNMVADAHTGGIDLVKPTPLPRRKVSMTIQCATLYSHTPTNKIYGIKRADKPDDPFKPLRIVSQVVGAVIELQAGGKITLMIDGKEHPLPVKDSGILRFDNDCRPLSSPACDKENDSLLFYNLVKGREKPPVRYIFTRIDDPTANVILSHPDGNCDPVVVDPPPGN
ncbi:MAG: hypothetical protein ACR2IA_09430 [Pyrinomonadaceae bacterium]